MVYRSAQGDVWPHRKLHADHRPKIKHHLHGGFRQNNKSLVIFGISGVQLRLISNLRICERYALVLASNVNIGVFEIGIDRNTDLSGGIRPLFLEVVGGCYHGKFFAQPRDRRVRVPR